MPESHFDFFVIGGGSGGVRAARIAASHGAKVGLAEKSALGGTCVNVGCVPKKLFAYAADYGTSLSEMGGFGWRDAAAHFDWQTLRTNKDAEIKRLNTAYTTTLEKAGVTIFPAAAAFIDAHTLDVGGQHITADKILIAVGGKPRRPRFDGAEHALVSDDLFYLENLPKRALIQGGGYIAVEFAHILHGLGVDVTLLYHGDLWLRGFDHDVRQHLYQEYLAQGINVRFQCDISTVTKTDIAYDIHLNTGDTITADAVFSLIGRVPYTETLNLETLGIVRRSNGQITVNQHAQTNIPHIYAVGDVSNAHNLTPYAIAEGHILADTLFGKGAAIRDINLKLIPTAVFSAPPIGTIGLSEEDAAKTHRIKTFKTSFRPMRHTLSNRPEKMLIKLVVCTETDKVLGCHIVGTDAPEILQGVAIAMNMGATKADFDRTIGIHPTSAEELVTLK